ncbi:hypothetical protein [Pseudomonas aeruginosa]|uniref:hypothetical protein n=1 Tax=Pseudomonas aeruginosa TaxID=287 RepID=UPI001ADCF95A|nr:hypothetical protein [Pseudomonas aeruginosa]MBO8369114.1 hypothetical protein [Pseudomonas aeruginosa]
MIQPLLDDLYAISQGPVLPDLEQILVVLGQHSDLIPHLMAVAADVDEEWGERFAAPGWKLPAVRLGGW